MSLTIENLSVTLLPFIISAGYPKCCQTHDLKVAGESSMVILAFSNIILPASFSSSSSFPSPALGSGRQDVAKAHYCRHRSQIEVWIAHKDRFLTQQEISSSLISRDPVARDLVTPLIRSNVFCSLLLMKFSWSNNFHLSIIQTVYYQIKQSVHRGF